MSITFPLDHSGNAPSNLVKGEIHSVNEAHFKDYFFLVPQFSPFYTDNLKLTLTFNGITTNLIEDVDYSLALPYITGTRVTGKAMYGAVTLHNLEANGLITMEYQTIGGDQIPDRLEMLTLLADKSYNPRTTIWDILTNVPNALPPTPHYQDYDDFYGQEEVVNMLGQVRDAILQNSTLTREEILKFLEALDAGHFDNYIRRDGDSMLGPLILHGNPLEDNEAVNKKYLNQNYMDKDTLESELSQFIKGDQVNTGLDTKVDKTGDTMSGPLILDGLPNEDNEASNKKYVDNLAQHVLEEFSRVEDELDDLKDDRVTKSYVDEKMNELKVYVETIVLNRL